MGGSGTFRSGLDAETARDSCLDYAPGHSRVSTPATTARGAARGGCCRLGAGDGQLLLEPACASRAHDRGRVESVDGFGHAPYLSRNVRGCCRKAQRLKPELIAGIYVMAEA